MPLSLEHQEVLQALWGPLCQVQELQFAEYSFANAFLFRREHQHEFVAGNPSFVRGTLKEGGTYLIPTVAPQQLPLDILAGGGCFFPLPDHWLPAFQRFSLKRSYSEADSDYLVSVASLRTLKGRRLSSRRNLIYQLEARYEISSQPLTLKEREQALLLLEEWQAHDLLSKEETDYFPCRDALEYGDILGLRGRIAYADGQPAGFILGELLTPHTALLHIAKGRPDIKGITPFLYHDFAMHLPENVQWINLEQDLGLPYLRQAKEAYAPERHLRKWRVSAPD